MDMSNIRPEIHVAQRSRRDKLRVFHHASNPPNHHLGVYNMNHMNQLPAYDPSEFCSEINNFSELAQKNGLAVHHQEPEKLEDFSTTNNFHHHPSDTVINRDPQLYFSTWKSMGSQPTTTGNCWVAANQTPNFVGEGLPCSSSFKIINSDNLGYQELNSPLGNNNQYSDQVSSLKHYGDHMHCSSSPFYQNALQELVSTSSVRSFVPMGSLRQRSSEETCHEPWVVNGGELLLLPDYGDQSGLKCPDNLINRPADSHQWNSELDFAAAKENSHTQALSLSLSSVPSPKVHTTQIAERDNAVDLQSRGVFGSNNVQDFRIQNLPTVGKILGNARQDSIGTQALSTHQNPGPLGPFTGYETVLRSSKFLRPAQILLEELCCVARPKNDEIYEGLDKILEEVRVFGEGVSNGEPGMKAIGGDSSGSLFGFNGSNDKSPETGGASSWMDSYRPKNFQKQAQLLYMQDEVCKKYKKYYQQMQMVISSFKSVAGLSAATPYVSLALKMVSKHFRCLKNAITNQLKSIRNTLGEELSSPTAAGTSGSSKGDASGFFDQSFQKTKGASNTLGILESQHIHIWRSQRGLPEQSVSILRAWLFDHFLHPYPTDTDKHMLATQTGLTRNQVSNWFINARVRVWKPMVEEIHMLEAKGMTAGTGSDGKTTTIVDRDQANDTGQCSNISKMPDNYSNHVDLLEHGPDRSNPISTWNQEKRSRIDYNIPTSVIEGSLMRFVPSRQTVSLTLGLRQSAENGQRPHYGGQIIRDFVG